MVNKVGEGIKRMGYSVNQVSRVVNYYASPDVHGGKRAAYKIEVGGKKGELF